MKNKQIATLEAKPHYALLDGLRGADAWYLLVFGSSALCAVLGALPDRWRRALERRV